MLGCVRRQVNEDRRLTCRRWLTKGDRNSETQPTCKRRNPTQYKRVSLESKQVPQLPSCPWAEREATQERRARCSAGQTNRRGMAVEETANDSKIGRSEAQKEKEHGTEVPCSLYLCPTGG